MVKDITGMAEAEAEVPAGSTVETVFERYASQFPGLRDISKSLVLASNQRFVRRSTPVAEGDEIAFLPPVSGGSPYTQSVDDAPAGHFYGLTRSPIDIQALKARVQRPEDGAVVVFEGVVRNNTRRRATLYLDYECYEAMAIRVLAELGAEIAGRHAIGRIAMVHRLGRMEIGECSVAVIVSAPHRKPAFEAALEGINRLKKTVPVWKKEHFADGEVWVEGEWDDSLPAAQ
jgi:molybdopterin synthase catalytic subunit